MGHNREMDASLPADDLVLVAGALVAFGILSVGYAQRIRVPGLLIFLAIGMLLGSDGLAWIDVGFDDLGNVQSFCVAALVLILYEGGLSTPLRSFRRVAAPGLVLATVGVALTAGVIALACHLVLGIDTTTSLLIGAVVASTDAAAVFSVLRGAPLPGRVRDVLQVESGLNDPMAVLLTIGVLEAWSGDPGAIDWLTFGLLQLGGGALAGIAVGWLGAHGLNRLHLPSASAYPVFALGVAGIAYGTSAAIGGSGFLAVYVAGLVVGHRAPRHRRLVRSFHDGLGSVAQIGLFFLLGLLVFPTDLPAFAGRGLLVAFVLVLVARPLAIVACLPWFGTDRRETAIVAWSGLRGAVPIVLATFPLIAGHPEGVLVFNIIFFVVLVSAAVQGLGVAPLARWLGLEPGTDAVDAVIDVVPFDQADGELVEIELEGGSPVVGLRLAATPVPDGTRLAAILRDDRVVVPEGRTVFRAGDRVLAVATESGHLGELEAWARGTRDGQVPSDPP